MVGPKEYSRAEKEDHVRVMLGMIGEDPTREGLLETPRRVVEAWDEWFSGYNGDSPEEILKCFEDGAPEGEGSATDEMVLVGGFSFYSHCEHHMAPFFGKAWVGYIPNGRVVGLSKIPRLVELFARRLQVQERITTQVADAIFDVVQPVGVGVVLRCQHMCVCSRGVGKDSVTTTSALRGALRHQPAARAEFMALCQP